MSNKIPLVIAPFKSFDDEDDKPLKYILFEYGDRTPVSSLSSSSSSSSPSPLPSPGSSSVLFKTELSSVPDHLKPYLVPYSIYSDLQSPSAASDSKRRRLSATNLPIHLRNLAVIDSTYSGSHKSSDLYFSILLPLLKAFGLAHVYVATTGPSTISNHAKSFSSSSTVVLLAGDTSIHEFVNSLTQTKEKLRLNVVVIPTGTGNALSASIGHENVAHAISRLFIGKVQPLSNMKIELPPDSYLIDPTTASTLSPHNDISNPTPISSLQSLVVTSWGFHAALVADSDSPEFRAKGPSRFSLAAKSNIEDRDQNYHGIIEFKSNNNEYKLEGPHSYVLFTLVSSLEKTFHISPNSSSTPNNVHLIQFNHLPGPQIMDIMHEVYDNSSHIKDPRVLYKKLDSPTPPQATTHTPSIIATLQINELDPIYRRLCIDGRIIIVSPKGTIRIYQPTQNYNGWDLYIVK